MNYLMNYINFKIKVISMKKLFSAFLCLIIAVSFAACGNKEKDKEDAKVDLEYYAKLGQIPECKYKLGDNVDTASSELSAVYEKTGENGEDAFFDVTEGEKTVCINSGDFLYYYEKEKKDAGISYIVALDTAYGFASGTPLLEVTNSLKGFDYTEEPADDSNTFFLLGSQSPTVLRYSFDKNQVLFVFDENSLCAVAVYSTENWNV